MTELFGKGFTYIVLTAVCLGTAFLLLTRTTHFPDLLIDLLDLLPYMAVLIGALLGGWFQSSRLFFAQVLVGIGYALSWYYLPAGIMDDLSGRFLLPLYAVFVPLGLLLFAFQEERGVLTPWGLTRLAVLLGIICLTLFIYHNGFNIFPPGLIPDIQESIASYLTAPWIGSIVPTGLPDTAVVSFAFVALVFTTRVMISSSALECGFLGATLAIALGLHFSDTGSGAALFFLTGSLLLILAVFQESYRMAFIDELTDLPARRALMADMKKLSGSYAIAMSDVDHFKKFNDTYGHDVGDQVLRKVASHLRRVHDGKAYRYGGEEFTILFPGKSAKEAFDALDKVRESIAESGFALRSADRPKDKPDDLHKKKKAKRVTVTISMGVAEGEQKKSNPEHIIRDADKALYAAKESGRNCVCIAGEKKKKKKKA